MKPVAEMTEQEKARTRAWIKSWQAVGPILEEVRAEEIRATDTVRAMEVLDGMFTHAVETVPARESSGLIEQQAIFARAKR
jgi:hypothetical protein